MARTETLVSGVQPRPPQNPLCPQSSLQTRAQSQPSRAVGGQDTSERVAAPRLGAPGILAHSRHIGEQLLCHKRKPNAPVLTPGAGTGTKVPVPWERLSPSGEAPLSAPKDFSLQQRAKVFAFSLIPRRANSPLQRSSFTRNPASCPTTACFPSTIAHSFSSRFSYRPDVKQHPPRAAQACKVTEDAHGDGFPGLPVCTGHEGSR